MDETVDWILTDGQGSVLVFVEADVLRLLTESAIARNDHDGRNFGFPALQSLRSQE
jgi:hypothetical protein